jgi:hypothetical protein
MVHARTRPIGDRERAGALARFDATVSGIAAWAVLSSHSLLKTCASNSTTSTR